MNASGRLNTCKPNGKAQLAGHTSGARVSNAYATYLQLGDSPEKLGLIPHKVPISHVIGIKAPVVGDGHAWH